MIVIVITLFLANCSYQCAGLVWFGCSYIILAYLRLCFDVLPPYLISVVFVCSTGIGIGYSILNAFVSIYYNIIIAISIYYIFGSLTSSLPWASCDNDWNTDSCIEGPPETKGAYFYHVVLL